MISLWKLREKKNVAQMPFEKNTPEVNVTKDTSSCFISQMFGKLEFRKSENAFICQIAIFTLFHHLNFSYILEMKQTDMS